MKLRFHICLLILTIALSFGFASAQDNLPCCTIIDINKDSSLVLIRNHETGWMKTFKPEALDLAELHVGDSIDVSVALNQVNRLKNKPRVYPLLAPKIDSVCCEVLEVQKTTEQSLVLAKSREGMQVRFSMPDSIASFISAGQKLYTTSSHGYAMLFVQPAADSTGVQVYGFPFLPEQEDEEDSSQE